MQDFTHRKRGDVKHPGYFCDGVSLASEVADFAYIVLGQFGKAISRPTQIDSAALAFAVSVIVGASAQEQMPRVDASRGIARMADAKAIGNAAFMQRVRKFMGKHLFRLSASVKEPISVIVRWAGPKPAGGSFLGVMQKPFFRRAREVRFQRNSRITIVSPALVMGAA